MNMLTLMISISRSIVIISTWENQVLDSTCVVLQSTLTPFFYSTILTIQRRKKNIRYNFQVNPLRQRCLMISLVGAGNTSCSKASALNSMGDVSATKTFSGFVRFCSGLCLISLHVLSLSRGKRTNISGKSTIQVCQMHIAIDWA